MTSSGDLYLGLLYRGVYVIDYEGRIATVAGKGRGLVELEYKDGSIECYSWRTYVHYNHDRKTYVLGREV